MSLQSKQHLRAKLTGKKYRDAFVASRIAQTIAFQLRVLRQHEGISQAALAKELGTSQNAISRTEDPQYGKLTVTNLRKIASYFDVGLVVRFAPYSEILDWTTNLSKQSIAVPSFDEDTELIERKASQHEKPMALDLSDIAKAANGPDVPKQSDTEIRSNSKVIPIDGFTRSPQVSTEGNAPIRRKTTVSSIRPAMGQRITEHG